MQPNDLELDRRLAQNPPGEVPEAWLKLAINRVQARKIAALLGQCDAIDVDTGPVFVQLMTWLGDNETLPSVEVSESTVFTFSEEDA